MISNRWLRDLAVPTLDRDLFYGRCEIAVLGVRVKLATAACSTVSSASVAIRPVSVGRAATYVLATGRVGVTPRRLIAWPEGLKNLAVVRHKPNLAVCIRKMPCTLPLPYDVSPTITPRRLSAMAPAKISLADALSPSIKTAKGTFHVFGE